MCRVAGAFLAGLAETCGGGLCRFARLQLGGDRGHDRSIVAMDLGDVASIIQKPPYALGCAASLASLIARLHSRGKMNEQPRLAVRPPVEEDAALSIDALGFVLREIGWVQQ